MAEQRVNRADFVETHFVDQLFEYQRVVGEQINAPLPVVKTDRSADDLPDFSRVTAADHAMVVHLASAFSDRKLVPVLVFSTAAVHGIEAGVTVRRDIRIQSGLH